MGYYYKTEFNKNILNMENLAKGQLPWATNNYIIHKKPNQPHSLKD
jgi:hypothetical protein